MKRKLKHMLCENSRTLKTLFSRNLLREGFFKVIWFTVEDRFEIGGFRSRDIAQD